VVRTERRRRLTAVATAYDQLAVLVRHQSLVMFGWATAFDGTSGDVQIRFGDQFPRALDLVARGVGGRTLVTRKPVRR
jgi:hypothetical protein